MNGGRPVAKILSCPLRGWNCVRDKAEPSRQEGGEQILELEYMRSLRAIGDSDADRMVSEILSREPPDQAERALDTLTRDLRSLEGSPEISAWVQEVDGLPAWVDGQQIARGQAVFSEWSLDIVTALFCASLPFAYAAAHGVEVLERISQLAEQGTVARRIAETGQMLLSISEPGALQPEASGYQTVRKVRLLHAVIRARLTLPTPGSARGTCQLWDHQALGVPINQEDLLGTLLSFTTVVFRALDRMGMPIGADSQVAYLQLWAAVGDLLGIECARSVRRPFRAEELTNQIAEELHAPSSAGTHLMAVLMDEMELSMPWGLRKLPRTLVRHLAGDQIADLLGVPQSAWWGHLLPALAALNRRASGFPAGRTFLQSPSRLLGRSMVRMWIDKTVLGEGPTTLHLSDTALSRLKIHTTPKRANVGLRGHLRGLRRTLRGRIYRSRAEPILASPEH
jgi:hypothetical protein